MNEKKYFRRLDILRVLACFLVLLYHLNIIKGGYLAVCSFFALSGYLGCMSAISKEKFSLGKYYVSRIKKIYIPLMTIVAITIIITKLSPNINWLNLKPESTSVMLGYNNFWQLSANLDYFTRHVNSPFMHLWYISILMQFELVFPIVFIIFKKLNKAISKNFGLVVVILLTIISTIVFYYMSKTQDIMIVYYNTFARVFSILFGVSAALVYNKFEKKFPKVLKSYSALIYFAYSVIFILLCIFTSSTSSHFAFFMILATIISIRLIRYSVIENGSRRKREKKSLFNSFIKFFSKCSYEIYLVQYPVIFFMQSVELRNLIKVPLIIIITIVIACIIHGLLNINKIKTALNILLKALISVIIVIGVIIVVFEKDNTKEMKELEELLNQNAKLIEEKNNESQNKANEENEKWLATLKSFDEEEKKVAETVRNLPVVGIGDSVLLGAINGLYEKFPNGYFDGKVSRSIIKSRDLFVELKNQGKLTNTMIIALSNNSDFFEWTFTDLLEILGDRQIYWITATYADDPKFNEKFKVFAKDYPNIHIVDWEQKSEGHPEYFYVDGIHLKDEGITAYANVIYDAIYEDYIKEYKDKKDKALKEHEEIQNEKIGFYGNDLLTKAYSHLSEKFGNSVFNVKSDYSYDLLYSELKTKIEDKSLERNLVFLFDKEANMTEDDYNSLADICKDYNLYICNTTSDEINISKENVTVIDFYSKINGNKDFLMSDKKHLSEKGIEALVQTIIDTIDGN